MKTASLHKTLLLKWLNFLIKENKIFIISANLQLKILQNVILK
jgi:hypothetical protein